MSEREVLLLTKKNARIVMLEDNSCVLYTYSPYTGQKNKQSFQTYEQAQNAAWEFMSNESV